MSAPAGSRGHRAPRGADDALARRYGRLLGAYPAAYRAERGDELVSTYLDTTGPTRRWPSPADVLDLVGGGLRQHLRARHALGLLPGARLAATLALPTAAGLAAVWLLWVELFSPVGRHLEPAATAPLTAGIVTWVGWLVVAVVAALAPGRVTRVAVGVALLLTVAVVPAVTLLSSARPPLSALLPQAALGAVALAWPARPRLPVRLAPALAGVAVAAFFVAAVPREDLGWYSSYPVAPGVAAAFLTTGAVVLVAVLGLRRDGRGAWAAVVLLFPLGLLLVRPIATWMSSGDATFGGPIVDFRTLALTAAVLPVLAAAAMAVAVVLRGREPAEPCPTCGHRPRLPGGTATGATPRAGHPADPA